MAALVDVGLLAAECSVRAVPGLLDVRFDPVGAVVAREHDQGVRGEGEGVESVEQPADAGVDLGHEVAVDAGSARAFELRQRHPGRVGRGQRQVEEEGTAVVGRRPLLQVSRSAIEENRSHLEEVEAGGDVAGAPVAATAVTPHRAVFDRPGGSLDHALVLDVEVRLHVEGGGDPEVVLEAGCDRPRPERHAVVGPAGLPVVGSRIGAESEMPLANAGGGVAERLEEPWQGDALRFEQGGGSPVQHAALQPRAPGVAAGEERVAGRRADRRRTVGVRQPYALVREPVEVGGRDP